MWNTLSNRLSTNCCNIKHNCYWSTYSSLTNRYTNDQLEVIDKIKNDENRDNDNILKHLNNSQNSAYIRIQNARNSHGTLPN